MRLITEKRFIFEFGKWAQKSVIIPKQQIPNINVLFFDVGILNICVQLFNACR